MALTLWLYKSPIFKTNPSKVGISQITFNDQIRHRILPIKLWYPVSHNSKITPLHCGIWKCQNVAQDTPIATVKSQYPLILFSHGYGGSGLDSSWFAQFLASHGFIVVTVDHYGNTFYNMLAQSSIAPFERARDITFVLDQLLEHPEWSTHIDSNNIGIAGFSQGGATALWLAGAQTKFTDIEKEGGPIIGLDEKKELPNTFDDRDQFDEILIHFNIDQANESFKDTRIKAVFAMAPGLGGKKNYFTSESLQHIKIPIYIIAGALDSVNPILENAQFFAKHIKNAQLTILPHATHWIFLNEGNELGKKTKPLLTIDNESIDRTQLHEIIGNIALNFFENVLNKKRKELSHHLQEYFPS